MRRTFAGKGPRPYNLSKVLNMTMIVGNRASRAYRQGSLLPVLHSTPAETYDRTALLVHYCMSARSHTVRGRPMPGVDVELRQSWRALVGRDSLDDLGGFDGSCLGSRPRLISSSFPRSRFVKLYHLDLCMLQKYILLHPPIRRVRLAQPSPVQP